MKYTPVITIQDILRILFDNPWLAGTFAVATALFELIYGPQHLTRVGMTLLIILIVIDWISGFSAAKKDGIDTSSYGIEGLMRTMVLLLLPAAARYIDLFFMTGGLASYFMIGALARHLTKSSTANVLRVGWAQWIPVGTLAVLENWASDEVAAKEARAKQRYEEIHSQEEKK